MTEIVTIRLDVAPATVGALHALLSRAERQRARRMPSGRGRARFIVGRARLRQLLGMRLGVRPESVALTTTPSGKPILDRTCAEQTLRFNVAHCDHVAAFAIGDDRDGEVGIDIEAVRVLSDADQLAARFFSRAEEEAYRALAPADRPLGFFHCWTRKEAFVKAQGEGLGFRPDRFDLTLALGERWCVTSFEPAPGFVGAVVTARRDVAHA